MTNKPMLGSDSSRIKTLRETSLFLSFALFANFDATIGPLVVKWKN
jgi:hypothetical protein